MDLPAARVDYPNACVDLPGGRVDLSDTIVDLSAAFVDLPRPSVELSDASANLPDGLVGFADALLDISSASVNRDYVWKDLELESARARDQRCLFWRPPGRHPGPRDVPARSAWGIRTGVGETLGPSGEPGRCDRRPVSVRELME